MNVSDSSTGCGAAAPIRMHASEARERALLLNGRFLGRTPTGVDRSATHLVQAMLRLRDSDPDIRFRLDIAVPRDTPADDAIRDMLGLGPDSIIHRGRLNGYAWEQLELPFVAMDATLLSLCNMGPLLRWNQLVLMHDAQVFEVPQSYSWAFRGAYRTMLPLLARATRWLATVSRSSRNQLRQHGVGAYRSMEVIPNGMDHLTGIVPDETIIARNGLQPGGYLLAIGSAAHHKNIAMLADVLKARSGPRLPLVLVGSECPQVFGQTGIPADEDVRCIGRVSDEELVALYADATVFLYPSITEGFGLPAGEAMSLGCPVIASTGGALPEVYGDAAQLQDPHDVRGWAAAIDRITASPATRQSWVERGRALVSRHAWVESSRALLRIVEAIP